MSKSSKERKTTESEPQVAKNPFEDDMSEDEPQHTDPLLEKDKETIGNDSVEASNKNKKIKKKTPSMLKGLKKKVSGKKSKTKKEEGDEEEKVPLSTEDKGEVTMTVSVKEAKESKQQPQQQPPKTKSEMIDESKTPQKATNETKGKQKPAPKTPEKSTNETKGKKNPAPQPPQKSTTDTKGKEKTTSKNPFGDTDEETPTVIVKKATSNPFGDSDDDDEEPPRVEIKMPSTEQPRAGLNNMLSFSEKLRASAEILCDKTSAMPSQTQSLPDRPKSTSTYVKGEKETKEKEHLSRKQKLRKSLPWRFKVKKKAKAGKDDVGKEEIEIEESFPLKEDAIELQKIEEKENPKGTKNENLEKLLQTTEKINEKMTDKSEEETKESSQKQASHTWPERKKQTDSIDVVDEGPSPGKSKGRPKVLKSLSWRLKGKKKAPEVHSDIEEPVAVHKVSSSPTNTSAGKSTDGKHGNEDLSKISPQQEKPVKSGATEYPESRSTTADDVRQVKAQVGGVKEVVYDNIKLLEERDHNLASLENLAENVQETSTMFKMVARRTHNKMRWRLWKWRLILIGGIVFAVVIIVIIIVVATLPSDDGNEGNDNQTGQPIVTVVPSTTASSR